MVCVNTVVAGKVTRNAVSAEPVKDLPFMAEPELEKPVEKAEDKPAKRGRKRAN